MIEFDDLEVPIAQLTVGESPRPEVKRRLMAQIRAERAASLASDAASATKSEETTTLRPAKGPTPVPRGFSFTEETQGWEPHPVPGIRMKLLSLNRARGVATLVLDVAPGTTFPEHHHAGAEECYVITGTVRACGRTIGPGDFHHADAHTDHDELYTETGCRVLLVVAPEDYIPGYTSTTSPAP
jgi:anti-sigma factor ChrR (cupin superfamily)